MGDTAQSPTLQAVVHAPYDLVTFDWSYSSDLESDVNYSDLALALSRNSRCDGGHMGTVIVKQGQLVALAVNSTLYDPTTNKSDVHAEANAICACARRGISLEDATIYITMPPCRNCFGLIQAAGIKRVVYRRWQQQPDMKVAAERLGIQMIGSEGKPVEDESQQRVKALWDAYILKHGDQLKQDKQKAKLARREQQAQKQQQKEARAKATGALKEPKEVEVSDATAALEEQPCLSEPTAKVQRTE